MKHRKSINFALATDSGGISEIINGKGVAYIK